MHGNLIFKSIYSCMISRILLNRMWFLIDCSYQRTQAEVIFLLNMLFMVKNEFLIVLALPVSSGESNWSKTTFYLVKFTKSIKNDHFLTMNFPAYIFKFWIENWYHTLKSYLLQGLAVKMNSKIFNCTTVLSTVHGLVLAE